MERSPRIQISIDRDFARFGSKSFAIRQINSVEVREIRPNSGTAAALFLTIALLCLVAIPAGGAGALAFAILFGGLGIAAWRKARRIEYLLLLTTSSGQEQATMARDRAQILALRDEIEARVREIHGPSPGAVS